jgi:hypothetical protein
LADTTDEFPSLTENTSARVEQARVGGHEQVEFLDALTLISPSREAPELLPTPVRLATAGWQ